MLAQEIAVHKITESLQADRRVKAVFLKGSMGRGEYDEHSDIDLYCLVDTADKAEFQKSRLAHLQAYRPVIFQDDIFIVAPQLIAVFDDLLHIDLFTVTADTFSKKDFFKVLYDPEDRLSAFTDTQGLELSADEFQDHVTDVAWFLFQYKKAAARDNDMWSVKMLSNAAEHLARVLLHRYAPNRAQLGLKTLKRSLPVLLVGQMEQIFERMTPALHAEAAAAMAELVKDEYCWIMEQFTDEIPTADLLREMIALYAPVEATTPNHYSKNRLV